MSIQHVWASNCNFRIVEKTHAVLQDPTLTLVRDCFRVGSSLLNTAGKVFAYKSMYMESKDTCKALAQHKL
jgi:hypothetical protein